MVELLVNMTYGALVGAVFALLGWLKSRNEKGALESPDVLKALRTLAIGLFVGGLLGLARIDFVLEPPRALLLSIAQYGGLIMLIELSAKAAWRWLRAKAAAKR